MVTLIWLIPFLLQVNAQTPGCLIIEEAANGWKSLTSPDYPKKFSPHTQCIYRVTAPKGERIEIEFVDFLLFNNDAEECAAQGLSIRDPEIETLIGKYCGNTKPPNYSTMGNSLFLYLESNTDGEYKGFHIKYRVYGSSPHLASEVEQSKPSKAPKAPKAKRPPVKAGGMGAKILAAMNSAKKVQLKSTEEKGDFDTNHLTASIDMQASPHRRRRQAYGRQQPAANGWGDYAAYGGPPARRAPAPKNRYASAADNTVQSRGPTAPKCRPGYPCNPDGTMNAPPSSGSSPSAGSTYISSGEREIKCIGNGCDRAKGSSSKRYLTYLIWFIVIAVFGGIGWYIYQTYFAEDEEKKKKEEEDEKKKEAEGNIGAATLARGLSGPTKIPGFDAPPRYESWQDHAQPIGK